jgi:NADH-ubiquinone oxidoreductase chain 1
MLRILYLLLEVLVIILPVLLAVAFTTIIERKQLAAMQRRVGPNYVGYYGVLQPFSDVRVACNSLLKKINLTRKNSIFDMF